MSQWLLLPPPLNAFYDEALRYIGWDETGELEGPSPDAKPVVDACVAWAKSSDKPLLRYLALRTLAHIEDGRRLAGVARRLSRTAYRGVSLSELLWWVRQEEGPIEQDLDHAVTEDMGKADHAWLALALEAWAVGDAVPEWITDTLEGLHPLEVEMVAELAPNMPGPIARCILEQVPLYEGMLPEGAGSDEDPGWEDIITTPSWCAQRAIWQLPTLSQTDPQWALTAVHAVKWLTMADREDAATVLSQLFRGWVPPDHVLRDHLPGHVDLDPLGSSHLISGVLGQMVRGLYEGRGVTADEMMPYALMFSVVWNNLPLHLVTCPEPLAVEAWALVLTALADEAHAVVASDDPLSRAQSGIRFQQTLRTVSREAPLPLRRQIQSIGEAVETVLTLPESGFWDDVMQEIAMLNEALTMLSQSFPEASGPADEPPRFDQ